MRFRYFIGEYSGAAFCKDSNGTIAYISHATGTFFCVRPKYEYLDSINILVKSRQQILKIGISGLLC